MIVREPYRDIDLTQGRVLAEAWRQRHAPVLSFLRALGVPKETAPHNNERPESNTPDACGDEHQTCVEIAARRGRIFAEELPVFSDRYRRMALLSNSCVPSSSSRIAGVLALRFTAAVLLAPARVDRNGFIGELHILSA